MFADPSAALASAVAIQRAAGAERWPPGSAIRVRMALHSGACVERDGDYFGPVVNRAARLLAAGHGGQVLVSGAACELLAGRLPGGIGLEDLGEHHLRDLGRPERVFQVTGPGLAGGSGPVRSLDHPALRHNLPAQATSFVGRAAELAELRSLVAGGSRLVTVAGPGGIGKSRLALQVAAEALDGACDGVWLVELAPVADPELVAARWPPCSESARSQDASRRIVTPDAQRAVRQPDAARPAALLTPVIERGPGDRQLCADVIDGQLLIRAMTRNGCRTSPGVPGIRAVAATHPGHVSSYWASHAAIAAVNRGQPSA